MKEAAAMFRRLAIAATAAMLLAGCVTTGPGPDGKPTDTTPGLVIFGFVYTGTHRTALGGCPIGRWGPFAGNYNFEISNADNDSLLTAIFGRIIATEGTCEPGNAPTPARYNFHELAPGRYQLDGIVNSMLRPLVILRGAPKFTIGPGEVVYIGDVTFSGLFGYSGISDPQFVMVNTADGARAALAARNGPADRMVVRPLEIILRPNYQ